MENAKNKYFNVAAIATVLVIFIAPSIESSPFDRHSRQPSPTELLSIVDSAPPEPRNQETFAIQSSHATITTTTTPHSNTANDLPRVTISSGATTGGDMTAPSAATMSTEEATPHGPISSDPSAVEPRTLLKATINNKKSNTTKSSKLQVSSKPAIFGGTSVVMAPRYPPFFHTFRESSAHETREVNTTNYAKIAVVSVAITLFVILLSLIIYTAVIVRRRLSRTTQIQDDKRQVRYFAPGDLIKSNLVLSPMYELSSKY